MKKDTRHQLIRELVTNRDIANQDMFVQLLREQGVQVTQATVSRDINELNLQKEMQPDGSFYYRLEEVILTDDKLSKLLKESVQSLDQMEKFIALKTVPGSAVALGLLLETVLAKWLFTNLTTDDKVLLLFKSEKMAKTILNQIKKELVE